MPVTESQFSLAQLWPSSNHNWMAPGAVASTAAVYGPGLDLGALRVRNGIWEILVSKTPTQADPSNSEWTAFEPSRAERLLAANAFNRYGPGWSYGPGHNLHDEVIGYFMDLNGREPTPMEKLDIEHDRGLWQKLLSDYNIKFGDGGTGTGGTGTGGTGTGGTGTGGTGTGGTGTGGTGTQTTDLPPLSSPEQRAAELLSLVPATVKQDWMMPVLVELIKAARRKEDRVVQRVLAGLKGNK